MNTIDHIAVVKRLADVAERFRAEQRHAEKLSASKDTIVAKHRQYWSELADRHKAQAELVDTLWQKLDADRRG